MEVAELNRNKQSLVPAFFGFAWLKNDFACLVGLHTEAKKGRISANMSYSTAAAYKSKAERGLINLPKM